MLHNTHQPNPLMCTHLWSRLIFKIHFSMFASSWRSSSPVVWQQKSTSLHQFQPIVRVFAGWVAIICCSNKISPPVKRFQCKLFVEFRNRHCLCGHAPECFMEKSWIAYQVYLHWSPLDMLISFDQCWRVEIDHGNFNLLNWSKNDMGSNFSIIGLN